MEDLKVDLKVDPKAARMEGQKVDRMEDQRVLP
jgi:hypothetical protein